MYTKAGGKPKVLYSCHRIVIITSLQLYLPACLGTELDPEGLNIIYVLEPFHKFVVITTTTYISRMPWQWRDLSTCSTSHWEEERREEKRTEQNRTEQNRTEAMLQRTTCANLKERALLDIMWIMYPMYYVYRHIITQGWVSSGRNTFLPGIRKKLEERGFPHFLPFLPE